ncbi:MAG: integrin alpha [Candidatus Dadabacteria bacterium]|nr:integrin alpha [Candidatus Dadabacteria bacterium]
MGRERIVCILIVAALVLGPLFIIAPGADGLALRMPRDLGRAAASFWGEDSEDNAGLSVAGAGDVNGDGYDDLLIGAYRDEDGGNVAGQTYLIVGKASGWALDTDLSAREA